MRKLIGLAGPKGVGKTTTATWIRTTFGEFQQLAFATPIKEMLVTMGVPIEYIYGNKKDKVVPELGVTGRSLQFTLGTKWGRDTVSKNHWVNIAGMKVDSIINSVIFDDVRMENEAEMIRSLGGIVIELTRDGVDYTNENETETRLPPHLRDFTVDLSKELTPPDTLGYQGWKSAIGWIIQTAGDISKYSLASA